jgi:hypothetical protein
MKLAKTARVHSPRLAHPEQAADFEMEIVESQQVTEATLSDDELAQTAEELFLELDQGETAP